MQLLPAPTFTEVEVESIMTSLVTMTRHCFFKRSRRKEKTHALTKYLNA